MRTNIRESVLFTLLFLLIASCSDLKGIDVSKKSEMQSTNQVIPDSTPLPIINEDECIGTFEEFAYYLPDSYFDYPNRGDISPLPPWELILEFPDDEATNYFLEEVQVTHGEIKIWIARTILEESDIYNSSIELIVYSLDSKKEAIYPGTVGDTNLWLAKLFPLEDGTMWGQNAWLPGDVYDFDEMPILSKFNEEIKRFEFDLNSMNVPVISNDAYANNDSNDIFIDQDDIFWLFIPFNGIFSYDPSKGITTKHANFPDHEFRHAQFAPDGNFYFLLDDGCAYDCEINADIYQFSPESGEVSLFDTADHRLLIESMLMDSTGRMWFSALGYRDLDGALQVLHPNIDRYFEKRHGFAGFMYTIPLVIQESSNGYLWFHKSRDGQEEAWAWYDPVTGKGCWFTNAREYNLIEEPENTMWFVTNGKIYRYSLSP